MIFDSVKIYFRCLPTTKIAVKIEWLKSYLLKSPPKKVELIKYEFKAFGKNYVWIYWLKFTR